MPPLSLTQSKYAFATFPIVVKSTPGISMSIPPILIGLPVAFLPLPRPHFARPAFADPTAAGLVAPAPAASDETSRAAEQPMATAKPIFSFLALIPSPLEGLALHELSRRRPQVPASRPGCVREANRSTSGELY